MRSVGVVRGVGAAPGQPAAAALARGRGAAPGAAAVVAAQSGADAARAGAVRGGDVPAVARAAGIPGRAPQRRGFRGLRARPGSGRGADLRRGAGRVLPVLAAVADLRHVVFRAGAAGLRTAQGLRRAGRGDAGQQHQQRTGGAGGGAARLAHGPGCGSRVQHVCSSAVLPLAVRSDRHSAGPDQSRCPHAAGPGSPAGAGTARAADYRRSRGHGAAGADAGAARAWDGAVRTHLWRDQPGAAAGGAGLRHGHEQRVDQRGG